MDHGAAATESDALANVLVAAPVLSWLSAYWKSHRIHRVHYGGDEDPCRRRFAAMGIGHIDLSIRMKDCDRGCEVDPSTILNTTRRLAAYP